MNTFVFRETGWFWPPCFISWCLGVGLNGEQLWQNIKWQSTDRTMLSSQNGAKETYWICGTNPASGRWAVGEEAGRGKSVMMSQRQRAEWPALDFVVWRCPRCWNTADHMGKSWKWSNSSFFNLDGWRPMSDMPCLQNCDWTVKVLRNVRVSATQVFHWWLTVLVSGIKCKHFTTKCWKSCSLVYSEKSWVYSQMLNILKHSTEQTRAFVCSAQSRHSRKEQRPFTWHTQRCINVTQLI